MALRFLGKRNKSYAAPDGFIVARGDEFITDENTETRLKQLQPGEFKHIPMPPEDKGPGAIAPVKRTKAPAEEVVRKKKPPATKKSRTAHNKGNYGWSKGGKRGGGKRGG